MESLNNKCSECLTFKRVNLYEQAAEDGQLALKVANKEGFIFDPEELRVHFRKTAEMIEYSCRSGLICSVFNPSSITLK